MESPVKKGKLLNEGKTKRIYEAEGMPGLVIIENKSAITAHDDPSLTRRFEAKAVYATTTTCRVFELLRDCGVETAYEKQLSPTEFLAAESIMVPLEIVARRYAVGSFLKRHPELATSDKKRPKRFHGLEIEFFLKTTGRKFGQLENLPTDDPLISSIENGIWKLAHPKKPAWEEGADFGLSVNRNDVLQNVSIVHDEFMAMVEKNVRRTFLALEKAWAILGIDLIDFKVEVDKNGRISDVVDNDSWRLWKNGDQLDKQVFRDGGGAVLNEVEQKYGLVAALSASLQRPKQALVIWRGSDKDALPDKLPNMPGLEILKIAMSGHKSTTKSLNELERIVACFPQGGAVVCLVGRSDGLAPVLAAHSPWPVIACPATLKEFPADAWSSLRMPSGVALTTAWPEANAIDAGLAILAQNNPAVYAQRQMALEAMDNYIA